MSFCEAEYFSIGGNRQSAAADCSIASGLVAFGADVNVALWQPQDSSQEGIRALLTGHIDRVTAVRFSPSGTQESDSLVSGSGDGEIKVWRELRRDFTWKSSSAVKGHNGAVNVIAFLQGSAIFATGAADCLIKLWKLEGSKALPLHTINLKPRYIPLALVLATFPGNVDSGALFLAVGGTRASVQILAIENLHTEPRHELQATLSGHEGWIRSLSLLKLKDEFLLASASHDKYVRIWRIRQKQEPLEEGAPGSINGPEKTLIRKVETFSLSNTAYTIIFEALLLGHEDWVYSASWNPIDQTQRLLTASADGSLAIWEPDLTSGIWVSKSRLGEISGQKGATTATGSAGGFWIGLWSSDGQDIMSLDRTGSWRLWHHDEMSDYWTAKPGVSGHIGSANSISWSQGGQYLLSTGSDQTSRLHAEWRRGQERTWHEFARPQIHGYDLNCIASVTLRRFVSGADEKLLRVFDEPKNVASLLDRLCSIKQDGQNDLPDAASMPVLGLSNKPNECQPLPDAQDEAASHSTVPEAEALTMSLNGDEPPSEDLLARHTLWPEHEKLYGHGYEISEAASNHDGTILATACKASSIEHAVIRLYDTRDWREIKPPLVAHSLTVTRLVFSCPGQHFLLSVGRDRQWTVFRQDGDRANVWDHFQAFPKAHSRMILDAAWSPVSRHTFFATAGRDKLVKLWMLDQDGPTQKFMLAETITLHSAVTAISFTFDEDKQLACLAAGEENGRISFHLFSLHDSVSLLNSWDMDTVYCLNKAFTEIQWRPKSKADAGDEGTHLAVAAADGSVRIFRIHWAKAHEKSTSKECQEEDAKLPEKVVAIN